MNILPKKRWHVRTKDNIARVRKDEAAAREEERKKQEKLEFAESEARVNFLRKRSGLPEKQQPEEKADEESEKDEGCSSQHVNLFADYKTHVKTTNKELEKEKKEEQEKYEKQIGYLTYLGQDTNEALRLKSWYEVAPKRLAVGSERGEINEKDLKTKHNHDPLTLINVLLPPDPKPIKKSTTTKRKRSPSPKATNDDADHIRPSKKYKKERKKHKKEKHKKRSKEHKHKKEKFKEKNTVEEQTQKRLKLEQLRKDRLRRETAERARQEALLAPKECSKLTEATSSVTPRVVQKYNSQFNPELAKQNMN
ncbi:leukocyte receptor cluster member 1 homolog [Calliphora vicina]|uniref:leukocyte receptor cluster member 1 homolog n=1 Tax=Calliphora vicina TaxID=7373 RepID=UPI00325BE94A